MKFGVKHFVFLSIFIILAIVAMEYLFSFLKEAKEVSTLFNAGLRTFGKVDTLYRYENADIDIMVYRVNFKTIHGKIVSIENGDKRTEFTPIYGKGDIIKVVYNPASPEMGRIVSFRELKEPILRKFFAFFISSSLLLIYVYKSNLLIDYFGSFKAEGT